MEPEYAHPMPSQGTQEGAIAGAPPATFPVDMAEAHPPEGRLRAADASAGRSRRVVVNIGGPRGEEKAAPTIRWTGPRGKDKYNQQNSANLAGKRQDTERRGSGSVRQAALGQPDPHASYALPLPTSSRRRTRVQADDVGQASSRESSSKTPSMWKL